MRQYIVPALLTLALLGINWVIATWWDRKIRKKEREYGELKMREIVREEIRDALTGHSSK